MIYKSRSLSTVCVELKFLYCWVSLLICHLYSTKHYHCFYVYFKVSIITSWKVIRMNYLLC